MKRIDSLTETLVVALELVDFHREHVNVSLLLISDPLKLRNVLSLLCSRLLQHLNVLSLLLSHLLIPLVVLVGSGKLLPEQFDIGLDFLGNASLSVYLYVERAQVIQLYELLLHVSLVLQRDWHCSRFDRWVGRSRLTLAHIVDRDGTLALIDARLGFLVVCSRCTGRPLQVFFLRSRCGQLRHEITMHFSITCLLLLF